MSRTSKHSGAIKTLQFNPFRSELLATGGAKGEVSNLCYFARLWSNASLAVHFRFEQYCKPFPAREYRSQSRRLRMSGLEQEGASYYGNR